MKTRFLLCILACMSASGLTAQDTLFFQDGSRHVGKILSVDAERFRIQRNVAPPEREPVMVTASLARRDVVAVEFGGDIERTIAQASTGEAFADLWSQWKPFLGIPRSPAGRVAQAYGEWLLATGRSADARLALGTFREIEASSWDLDARMRARQGRLRAMIATGHAAAAATEAAELAKLSEDPAILVEAKFILAEADNKKLRAFLKDNPRWKEDPFAIPEYERLRNQVLDGYLFASLFFGSNAPAAARGLWGATQAHLLTEQPREAVECARDIVALYPETPFAAEASKFLESHPPEPPQPTKPKPTIQPTPEREQKAAPKRPTRRKSKRTKKS